MADTFELGYFIACEEHGPREVTRNAALAEQAGFTFALISDHFHPWVDSQGQSPFVWGAIGAIASATSRLRLGTGVTCPIMRIHPAIIAQAAATSAALMPGRFFLGLGSGENLNEHITGQHWPPPPVRLEMLEEAVHLIRQLWQGGYQSRRGGHFTLEDARLYTLPEEPPPIMLASSGPRSTDMAARIGDGLVNTAAKPDLVQQFVEGGGNAKPRYGQLQVCWDEDEARAREIAHRHWPISGLPGPLHSELRMPRDFDAAAGLVTQDAISRSVVCGPDPQRHLEGINRFAEAGYSHIYVHQIGPNQEGFFRFYQQEVIPRLSREAVTQP